MFFLFNRYLPSGTFSAWVIEGIVIFATALAVTTTRLGFENMPMSQYDPFFLKTLAMSTAYIISFNFFNLYRPDVYRPSLNMTLRLLQATIVATIIMFAIFYAFPNIKTARTILLFNTFLLPPILLLTRATISRFLVKMPDKKVLIIGSGSLAKQIGDEVHKRTGQGLKLVGFIDDDPSKLGVSIVNPGVVGGYGDLKRVAQNEGIDMIIIALNDRRAKLPMSALLDCKLLGVTVEEGETFNERMDGKIPVDHLKPSWMVFSDGFKSLRSRKLVKRTFDLAVGVTLLLLTTPLMIITAIIIKLESRGPMIFKQVRVGEHGREFNIYKFRSMRQDAEAKTGPVWANTTDNRVTRVGKVIRLLRIDELPQLINVFKGDMSFVGPRPEHPFFVKKLKEVIPYYEIRTVVKPGITGWAQIKYPYGASVQDALEKLQYDIYYIKNMSPLLDILIFFWTIKVVFTGKGAR